MKRTEPSTNRKFAPPGEGLPNPWGDRLSPSRGSRQLVGSPQGLNSAHDLARHECVGRAVGDLGDCARMVAAEHINICRVMAQGVAGVRSSAMRIPG